MTTNHIDQLAEWWESADVEGIVRAGDTIIKKGRAGYDIYTAWSHEDGEDVTMWKYEQDPPVADYRILARAPEPKPAWHDAVAVLAHTARFSERRPFALTHTEDVLDPYNTEWITRDNLIDPVPLIEAKVTDEMVERALTEYDTDTWRFNGLARMRHALTAALGLEAA